MGGNLIYKLSAASAGQLAESQIQEHLWVIRW